jgi:hypothetical protein
MFKQSTTIEILPVSESDNNLVNVAGIWRRNPATFAGIRSAQIPATNLAREPVSGRIWPERLNPGRPWLERPVPGRLWPERPDPASLPGSWLDGRNPAIPDSDETVRNQAILDSDETVRIPAFISNSDYISRNQVKMIKILSFSDRISSSMIFILFYINIYMF